jgi:hypothetical protein
MSPPKPEQTRVEDVPVVEVELADGNTWGLALPGPRLQPLVRHDSDPFGRPRVRIELAARVGYPIEIRRLCEGLVSACREDDAALSRDVFLGLAIALLRAAHDIDAEEASALLDPRRVDLGRVARMLIPAAFGGDADLTRSGGR